MVRGSLFGGCACRFSRLVSGRKLCLPLVSFFGLVRVALCLVGGWSALVVSFERCSLFSYLYEYMFSYVELVLEGNICSVLLSCDRTPQAGCLMR